MQLQLQLVVMQPSSIYGCNWSIPYSTVNMQQLYAVRVLVLAVTPLTNNY
jgi:hypothetical protein